MENKTGAGGTEGILPLDEETSLNGKGRKGEMERRKEGRKT